MKNFKATIQVAEDAQFRKTVLDAIEHKTEELLPTFITAGLSDLIARKLSQTLAPEVIKTIFREEAAKQINHYIHDDPTFNALMQEYYRAAQAEVATKVEDLMSKATENVIRKAMMLMGK